jgi:hypothetical protein
MWRTIRPIKAERSGATGEVAGGGDGGEGEPESSRAETAPEAEDAVGKDAGEEGLELTKGPVIRPLPVDAPSEMTTSLSFSCRSV